ncbi:MAG: protein BatD, partial [Lysobacterales bacterium]
VAQMLARRALRARPCQQAARLCRRIVAARRSQEDQLALARAERPAIQHLGDLAAALDDASQRAAIATLQQRHYAGTPVSADGSKLAEAFKRGFVWRVTDAGDDNSELPPLYPFKLH